MLLRNKKLNFSMEDNPKKGDLLESLESGCHESYMTPWATVIAMFALYLIALLWFCRRKLFTASGC